MAGGAALTVLFDDEEGQDEGDESLRGEGSDEVSWQGAS
jgi:hypothetical protein